MEKTQALTMAWVFGNIFSPLKGWMPMPWFKAVCGMQNCRFNQNFEAEDIKEAAEMARVDHQVYSPTCLRVEQVDPSDLTEESFSPDDGLDPFGNPLDEESSEETS